MSRAFHYDYGVRGFAFATEWSYEIQKNLLILNGTQRAVFESGRIAECQLQREGGSGPDGTMAAGRIRSTCTWHS